MMRVFTPQFKTTGSEVILKDTSSKNSRFFQCSNDYEIFNRFESDGHGLGGYENVSFSNNISIDSGSEVMTELNDDTKGALLLTDYEFSPVDIVDNLFIRPSIFVRARLGGGAILKRNTVYIEEGAYLYKYKDLPRNEVTTELSAFFMKRDVAHSSRLNIGDTIDISCNLISSLDISTHIRISFYTSAGVLITETNGDPESVDNSALSLSEVVPATTDYYIIEVITGALTTLTLEKFYLRNNGLVFCSG